MLFELSIVLIVIGFIFSTLFGGFDSFSSRTFVGNLLILAGSSEALEPFRATRFTCVVVCSFGGGTERTAETCSFSAAHASSDAFRFLSGSFTLFLSVVDAQ
jgi:hypothetical protein